MNVYVLTVIGIICGYLIGSIPFALIIGKVFYKTDVRNYGSGNLGSTNVARTLGPVAGILVLILDLLKGGLVPFIMYKISESVLAANYPNHLKYLAIIYCVTGFFVSLGHCHPIFAKFKGGKAVASICGFLLFMNYRLGLLAIIVFSIVILISRIVSLGSVSAAIVTMICQFIPFFRDCYLFTHNDLENSLTFFIYTMTLLMLGILLIYRHLGNINRLIHGQEKKFEFPKKNKDNKEK